MPFHRDSWARSLASVHAVLVTTNNSFRAAASAGSKTVQQDWHRVSAAAGHISRSGLRVLPLHYVRSTAGHM